MDISVEEINDALLWLAERQGSIHFKVDPPAAAKDATAKLPTVEVKAVSIGERGKKAGAHPQPLNGLAPITAGNAASALLAAIRRARSQAK